MTRSNESVSSLPRLGIFHNQWTVSIFDLVAAARGVCRIVWIIGWEPNPSDARILARFGDVADVTGMEEIDIVRKGENYGWNVMEGFERFSNKFRRESETLVPPIFSYTRKYGQCVTGGFVYRANPKSTFYGVYIFGDYQKKRLFALTQKDLLTSQIATAQVDCVAHLL